jgi:hypothetical protein
LIASLAISLNGRSRLTLYSQRQYFQNLKLDYKKKSGIGVALVLRLSVLCHHWGQNERRSDRKAGPEFLTSRNPTVPVRAYLVLYQTVHTCRRSWTATCRTSKFRHHESFRFGGTSIPFNTRKQKFRTIKIQKQVRFNSTFHHTRNQPKFESSTKQFRRQSITSFFRQLWIKFIILSSTTHTLSTMSGTDAASGAPVSCIKKSVCLLKDKTLKVF